SPGSSTAPPRRRLRLHDRTDRAPPDHNPPPTVPRGSGARLVPGRGARAPPAGRAAGAPAGAALAPGREPPLRGSGTAAGSHRGARARPRAPAPAGAPGQAGALPARPGDRTGLAEGLLRLRRPSLRLPLAA